MTRIIDTHTHIYPDHLAGRIIHHLSQQAHLHPFSDGRADSLLQSMSEAGISVSLVLPVATREDQVKTINRRMKELNMKYAGKIISLGAVHPADPDYERELEWLKESGFKGIKVHPVYQGANLDDPRFLKIFAKAKELDLVVVTHAGIDIGAMDKICCSPGMARHVVDKIGPFKFVLAHMGGWHQWDDVVDTLKDTGVYLDTAFSMDAFTSLDDYWKKEETVMLSKENMTEMIYNFGADRILFGTDSPWSSQKSAVEFMDSLPLSEKEKLKIFSLNAKRLFGIKLC